MDDAPFVRQVTHAILVCSAALMSACSSSAPEPKPTETTQSVVMTATPHTPDANQVTTTVTTTKTVLVTPTIEHTKKPSVQPKKQRPVSVDQVAQRFVTALVTWRLTDSSQVDASKRAASMAVPTLAKAMTEDRPASAAFARWKAAGKEMQVTLQPVTDTPPDETEDRKYRAFVVRKDGSPERTIYVQLDRSDAGWAVSQFRSDG